MQTITKLQTIYNGKESYQVVNTYNVFDRGFETDYELVSTKRLIK